MSYRQPGEKKNSGEPLPDSGIAEEPLILEIGEPCLGEGFELLLQLRIDVGLLAGIVIAIHFLKEAHIVVLERQRFGSGSLTVREEFKDHVRVAHEIAVLLAVVAERNEAVAVS